MKWHHPAFGTQKRKFDSCYRDHFSLLTARTPIRLRGFAYLRPIFTSHGMGYGMNSIIGGRREPGKIESLA